MMKKKLPDFSMVGNVSLSKCKTGKVDYIEDHNVINRVDFVEKGACTTCNVEYGHNLLEAKSIIGDIMVEEGNNGNNNTDGQEGENQDPSLADVAKSITNFKKEVTDKLDNMDERITAIEGGDGEAGNAGGESSGDSEEGSEGETKDPKLEALEAKVASMEAKAAEKEATSLVNGYIEEGKILPKDVKDHVELALSEPEGYQKIMAKAPVVVEIDKRHSSAEAGNPDNDESEEYTDKDFAEDYEAAYGEKPE